MILYGIPDMQASLQDWVDNFKIIQENIRSAEEWLDNFKNVQHENISNIEEFVTTLLRYYPTQARTGRDLSVYMDGDEKPVARSVINLPGFRDFTFEISSVLSIQRAIHVYMYFLKALYGSLGDICEFGVYRGETSRELCRFIEYAGLPQTVYMFDTFRGLLPGKEGVRDHYLGTEKMVEETMCGLSQYVLVPGLIGDRIRLNDFDRDIAFAHIDCDLFSGTRDSILLCEKNMPYGGYIVVDDYGTAWWPGVKEACDEFIIHHPEKWSVIDKSVGQLVAQRT